MGKEDTKDLIKFLKPFPDDVKEIALWLREWVWSLYPTANEIIYDNYNAVAFGWSITEKLGHTFCTIAVGRSSHNVHFGFYYGAKLSDPKKILLGQGNQYRYILIKKKTDLPQAYIKQLIKEAYSYSKTKVKEKDKDKNSQGLTITKSISAAKRPAKKTAATKRKK